MMNRDFFPDKTERFDASVRQTLAALPEKRRARRMTAGQGCRNSPRRRALPGRDGPGRGRRTFPAALPRGRRRGRRRICAAAGRAGRRKRRLAPDGGQRALRQQLAHRMASLRLENLKGDGKMPFKVAELLPEYQNQPGMSWTLLADIYANDDGECWFNVLDAAGDAAFTGRTTSTRGARPKTCTTLRPRS